MHIVFIVPMLVGIAIAVVFAQFWYFRLREKALVSARDELLQENSALQNELRIAGAQAAVAAGEQKQNEWLRAQLSEEQQKKDDYSGRLNIVEPQLAAARQQLSDWDVQAQRWESVAQEYKTLQQQHAALQVQFEGLRTRLQQEEAAGQEKITLLQEVRESMGSRFKTLANEILEEKSKKFSEQNLQSLDRLLTPMHERMQDFGRLVQNTYEKEAKERTSLEGELKRLQELNTRLHTDAKALTDALTGTQNKSQGNWGEMILERVLENSGLQKGREYIVQVASVSTDENDRQRRLQPDVLVNLPDNKQIIIDAKVSLTAYVRYTQATDADTAAQALRAHVQSVRNHVKGLSEKRYDAIEGLNTLDFVFMFIPVEPAYLLALQQDNSLFDECFRKRIMPVGPSTLLATLRTVANIWRNEQQNQNALAIAQEGGRLYDKFAGFVSTLESVGKNIDQAQTQYQTAMKQLSTGRGNLMTRARKLEKLGVQTGKTLPGHYGSEDGIGIASATTEEEPE